MVVRAGREGIALAKAVSVTGQGEIELVVAVEQTASGIAAYLQAEALGAAVRLAATRRAEQARGRVVRGAHPAWVLPAVAVGQEVVVGGVEEAAGAEDR